MSTKAASLLITEEELLSRAIANGRTIAEEKEIAALEKSIQNRFSGIVAECRAIETEMASLREAIRTRSPATEQHLALKGELESLRGRQAVAAQQLAAIRSDAAAAQAAVDEALGVPGVRHDALRDRVSYAQATAAAVAGTEQLLADLDSKVAGAESALVKHAAENEIKSGGPDAGEVSPKPYLDPPAFFHYKFVQ